MVTLDELLLLYDSFGYAGILMMSFIISILFFLPIPYFPVPLIAAFNKNLDPHLIALSGTAGAVAAKMIIFYLAYSGHNIITKKSKGRTMSLQKLLGKYGWIGALVATVMPFSGNLIYITLGLTRYNPWKFAAAVFVGELLYNEFIVWVGVFLGRPFVQRVISEFTNTDNPTTIIIAVILSTTGIIITLYLLVKINWNKIIGKRFPWTSTDNTNE
ncbi:MAG TPA: VTT domain-containing protein [Nitrososphaeraceae archaeon]|nr:VTT domain-containing protein [Nitrososphaeraceae archaeon]